MEAESVAAQQRRYDREAAAYDQHRSDPQGQAYRTEFIRKRLLPINLKGMTALDAMCASGIETGWLIAQGALVTGLDVSSENARLYREAWGLDCAAASIHQRRVSRTTVSTWCTSMAACTTRFRFLMLHLQKYFGSRSLAAISPSSSPMKRHG